MFQVNPGRLHILQSSLKPSLRKVRKSKHLFNVYLKKKLQDRFMNQLSQIQCFLTEKRQKAAEETVYSDVKTGASAGKICHYMETSSPSMQLPFQMTVRLSASVMLDVVCF